jgi:hypothetical protein
MFNLFNTTNFNPVDITSGVQRDDVGQTINFKPNFGCYTEAFDLRSPQLTSRLEF